MTDEMIIQLFWDRREEAIRETEKRIKILGDICKKYVNILLRVSFRTRRTLRNA